MKKKFVVGLLHNYLFFFAKFHRDLLKKFEVTAYIFNWAFFGCSQSCPCFLNMSTKSHLLKFKLKIMIQFILIEIDMVVVLLVSLEMIYLTIQNHFFPLR